MFSLARSISGSNALIKGKTFPKYGQLSGMSAKFSRTKSRFSNINDGQNNLSLFIKDKIRVSGPISVAEFMRMAVSSPSVGYYSRFSSEKSPIFGAGGDFITAPELSQMFGEMLGVWCYYELANTGHIMQWQIVESGPGTGQLMNDVLNTMSRFEEDKLSVHLVELSDKLILEQERLLCRRPSKFIEGYNHIRFNTTHHGFPVYWYRSMDEIPQKFSVFIANEFLDALPIHQFKKDEKGHWHEVYINLDHSENLCFMLSKGENLMTKGLLPEVIRERSDLWEWEISPDAGTYVNQVAEIIVANGGFSIMIDYGHDGSRKDFSLRAYSKHELVNPLDKPGERDITADVNFGYLKGLVEDRCLVYGPTEQREFLAQMGIGLRLRRLLQSCEKQEDQENLIKSYNMLMSEEGLGTRFKVMSMFPKTLKTILDKRNGPAGFLHKKASSDMK
ncbi:hypothetical protein AB6A40_004325 [Gnathostoma spinigerum]|uniref:Protein arginine methyltransferase NDUFAF7 n=1 Tax=Gnathostoma spinigerum TaxID=75299 RepID=A0ABD6ED80_9BILA